MKWSLKLAQVAGIEVRVHWTFAILLVWLALASLSAGNTLWQAAISIGFVLSIFLCVLLHEFGHALMARRFGIRTPDITLLPIGGVARLERIPEKPGQEFLIAIAGPLVNVAIAIGLAAGIWLVYGSKSIGLIFSLDFPNQANFWFGLLMVNLVLVAFNMIPAFPMDGGRVLRAVLAQNMDYVKATELAANVGQVIAIGFGIVGLFYNWFLLFIAMFVYLGAQAEAQAVATRALLAGVRVADAMLTRFVTADPQQPISTLVTELLAGDQVDFPVVRDGELLGMVGKHALIKAIAEGNVDQPIHTILKSQCSPVEMDELLRSAFETMQQSDCSTLPVLNQGRLVGLLNQTNIAEFLMIQSAVRAAQSSKPPGWRPA